MRMMVRARGVCLGQPNLQCSNRVSRVSPSSMPYSVYYVPVLFLNILYEHTKVKLLRLCRMRASAGRNVSNQTKQKAEKKSFRFLSAIKHEVEWGCGTTNDGENRSHNTQQPRHEAIRCGQCIQHTAYSILIHIVEYMGICHYDVTSIHATDNNGTCPTIALPKLSHRTKRETLGHISFTYIYLTLYSSRHMCSHTWARGQWRRESKQQVMRLVHIVTVGQIRFRQ